MIRARAAARRASLVGLAGAALQVGYGLLAVAFPYPAIIDPQWELLWAVASAGMLAGVVGWYALDVARPRSIATISAGLAIVGLLIRIGISVLLVLRPSSSVDGPIVATILMAFSGLTVLWIGTLVGRRLTGWQAWAPAFVVAVGLGAAAMYSVDRILHFIMLGLGWGPAWMLLSYVVYRQATQRHSPVMVGGIWEDHGARPARRAL